MSAFFTIIGGLGVFLFGMRLMSGGLQKLAGARLRGFLAGMTRNRPAGIFSGFLMTCAVQSSSATTVLVVSFANAGLLTLVQAMGLVMGANIGTTITAWLISLLGFKVKIAAFALPIIGLGFPLSFLRQKKAHYLAEVMVGFGLLFLGLEFLKEGVPDLKSNPEMFEFVTGLTQYGFFSRILFVAIGTVLTVVVQSSSAASAITLTMIAKDWISLDLAAAMILGENIGTTITAQLASIGANRTARRVANFHTMFNVIGVLWILPVMGLFLSLITDILPDSPTKQVAMFHTMFNVTNTLILVWFTSKLEKVVMWTVPKSDEEHEGSRLQFLESSVSTTSEMASISVRRALREMVTVCQRMFVDVTKALRRDGPLPPIAERVRTSENVTDEMEEEIVAYCGALSEHDISADVSRELNQYLDMTNDVERIGDHEKQLIELVERATEKGYKDSDEAQAELVQMTEAISQFFEVTVRAFDRNATIEEARACEKLVNKLRREARRNHAARMQTGDPPIRQGILYLDMMTDMEKIGDYCWNVCALLLAGVSGEEASKPTKKGPASKSPTK